MILMGFKMSENRDDSGNLLRRIAAGDAGAVAELFAAYRDRLRLMVRLRLDRRLQGRLDPSDVLQEAYLDIAHRAPAYAANPTMSPYLWLRYLTGQPAPGTVDLADAGRRPGRIATARAGSAQRSGRTRS
jgi:hypothetical protein